MDDIVFSVSCDEFRSFVFGSGLADLIGVSA